MCVYTSDKPSAMHRKFQPILAFLGKQLSQSGIKTPLKLSVHSTYNGAIDALAKGDCSFSRLGPASYILAKTSNPQIQLIAAEHKQGNMRFFGHFIVAKNSPIQSTKQLKGKTFAFGNQQSTIGRYLSQAELVRIGITAKDLSSYKYLGRHDKVALAVAVGSYQVGVVKENTYHKYAKSRGLKSIGKFPNVTKPWVAKANLDPKLFTSLQKALLGLRDKSVLKVLKQDGFKKTTDQEYDFVRKGMLLSNQFNSSKP